MKPKNEIVPITLQENENVSSSKMTILNKQHE